MLAFSGHMYLLREVIVSSADFNARDKGGRTPLHYAAADGQLAAVKCLVTAGASISAMDANGDMPIEYACREGRTHLVEYLRQYGTGNTDDILVDGDATLLTVSKHRELHVNSDIDPFTANPGSKYDKLGLAYISKDHWDAITPFERALPSTPTTKYKEFFEEKSLIQMSLTFHTTDRRDKIYALSALARFNRTSSMQRPGPDYTIPVEQCYASYTRYVVESTRRLEVLKFVGGSSKKLPNLPSWTPDHSADGGSHLKTEPWHLLAVMGMEFDTVDFVANPGLGGRSSRSMAFDTTWLELISRMHEGYHTGQDRTEAFWRTLCIDQGVRGEHPASQSLASLFKRFVCALVCRDADTEHEKYLARKEQGIRAVERVVLQMIASVMDDSSPRSNQPRYFAMHEEHLVPEVEMPDRSLDTATFDDVRPAFNLLSNISGAHGRECFVPSLRDIENYLAEERSPIVPETPQQPYHFTSPEELIPIGKLYSGVFGYRRPFLTRGGYVGLGPLSMQKGDVVSLLEGADSPFILRPQGA
ncbi:hypothetical protein VTI74DRAFT_445 [Chaetomium olivicolor]